MKFTRRIYQSPPPGAPEERVWDESLEVYEQPVKDRLVYLAYHVVWMASWKVKLISKLINLIEKVDLRRHKKSCDGCGWVTRVATGERTRECVYMPLDARLDCRHYDLDVKNSIVLGRTEAIPRISS